MCLSVSDWIPVESLELWSHFFSDIKEKPKPQTVHYDDEN